MSEKPQPGEKINLSPGKEIYRSAAVDVDYVEAVKELVDNAIDNWARVSRRTDDVVIEIEAKDGRTVVEDDSGGLDADEIKVLFALGETLKQNTPNTIGAYGVGAKKAIVRLGDEAVIKSHSEGEDTGIGFRVDQDWLDADEDWEVTLEEFEDLPSRKTVIEVESENEIRDQRDPETDEASRLDALRNELSATYARFIRGEIPQGGSVTIVLNGEEVEAPDEINWSFTPFDGMHPRRYKNIQINHSSLSEPVSLSVTVGFMRQQDSDRAGTDFYCQDRLVIQSDRGETGGYGPTTENKIGRFTSQNNRLKVIVDLKTLGDSGDLPWDGQKSSIDPYDPITRAVHDWLRRLVRPYFELDAGKVKLPYVGPYTADHEHAANEGSVQVFDYNGRERVGSAPEHKPDTDRPRVKAVEKMVRQHVQKGIRYYDELHSGEKPAYETRLTEVAENEGLQFNDLELVDEIKEDEDKSKVDDKHEHIDDVLADVDGAGKSRREALFTAGFETRGDLEEATKEDLMSVESIGENLANNILISVGALEDLESQESNGEDSESKDKQNENKRNKENLPTGLDGNDGKENQDDGRSFRSNDTSETASSADAATGGTEGLGSPEAGESSDGTDIKDLIEEYAEEPGNTPSDVFAQVMTELDEDEAVIPLVLSTEEYDVIRNAVGVSEDSSPREVGRVVAEKLMTLYGPVQTTADD
jgi:hypothetical protein